jgi:glycosyltransferase involved in cell wall biosynthesis
MSERRLRVLAIASHAVQYASPQFRLLARHEQIDFHVAYCSLRGAEAGHDREFDAVVQWDVPLLDGYEWTHVSNRGSGLESFFGLFNPGLWKLIRQGKYDAILCYTGYRRASFWIAYVAAKISGTRFLFGTDATTLAARDERGWKKYLKRFLWPRVFRLADQVIVPSSGTRELMLSLGLPPERVTLTPYTVDNEWWLRQSLSVDRDALRAQWGAGSDDLVVLFCAKLQSWKRPSDLLRAFAQTDFTKALLVLAGEGPLHSELQAEAISLGIASRVRFLGFVNQSRLPSIYTSADVMVLPSGYEPFAVVVNEAMCCACPVISSDAVGAAQDLIAPISPEFIYRCGDVAALAEILKTISTRRSELRALGNAAREHMQSWSPTQNVAATVEAVRTAVYGAECSPIKVSVRSSTPDSLP